MRAGGYFSLGKTLRRGAGCDMMRGRTAGRDPGKEPRMLSKEQLAQYFQRIGYEGTPDRTSATLGAIQEAHLNAIPTRTWTF